MFAFVLSILVIKVTAEATEKPKGTEVFINKINVPVNWTAIGELNGTAEYKFVENQIVSINCSNADKGLMKYEVKDEPGFFEYVTRTNIFMLMKMRTEPDGKYIDCFHNKSGVITIVRIMLRPKKTGDYLGVWQVDINQQQWVPVSRYNTYWFVPYEKVAVECKKSQAPTRYGHFSGYLDTFKSLMYCPKDTSNEIIFNLEKINTRGIRGLSSHNILLAYNDSKNRLNIHYEYDVDSNLTLSWNIPVENGNSNQYNVYWEGTSLKTTIIEALFKQLTISITAIILLYQHDRRVIKFLRLVEGTKNLREVTLIVLRRKTSDDQPEVRPFPFHLEFYIAVGVAGLLIVVILMISLCLIRRKKTKAPNNVNPDYGNLECEATSIAPFPSQWDTYANTMEDNTLNSVQNLYTKPIPKSLRKGKLPSTYTNVTSNSRGPEPLYSDIEGYDNTNRNVVDDHACYTNMKS